MDFPSIFPLKVMGANDDDFEGLVLAIIGRHAALVSEKPVIRRLSRGGRYLSLTMHVQAESQAQLDALYRELSAHERVLMIL